MRAGRNQDHIATPTVVGAPFVSMGRAAAHAAVRRRTVRRWVQEGLLPAHRLSGHWGPRVQLADVDELARPARLMNDEADERLWTAAGEPSIAGNA